MDVLRSQPKPARYNWLIQIQQTRVSRAAVVLSVVSGLLAAGIITQTSTGPASPSAMGAHRNYRSAGPSLVSYKFGPACTYQITCGRKHGHLPGEVFTPFGDFLADYLG
jgi:hypothetical protein